MQIMQIMQFVRKQTKNATVLQAPGILERRTRQSGRIQDRSGGRLAPGKSVVQFL